MERSTNRITELAAMISQKTEQISFYLSEHNLSPPSFDVDAPLILPEVLRSARKAVVEASEELKSLMQGPKEATKSEIVSPSSLSLHPFFLYLSVLAP